MHLKSHHVSRSFLLPLLFSPFPPFLIVFSLPPSLSPYFPLISTLRVQCRVSVHIVHFLIFLAVVLKQRMPLPLIALVNILLSVLCVTAHYWVKCLWNPLVLLVCPFYRCCLHCGVSLAKYANFSILQLQHVFLSCTPIIPCSFLPSSFPSTFLLPATCRLQLCGVHECVSAKRRDRTSSPMWS